VIVVDTSVAVKWVVEEDRREAAKLVLRSGAALLAPDFMISEAANVLRRKVRRGEASIEQMRLGMTLTEQSVRL
jgi:predicted nucleic acid-binding protein